MAAHAVDEFIEAMDMEERSEGGDAAAAYENGVVDHKTGLPFLPPLPPKAAQSDLSQVRLGSAFLLPPPTPLLSSIKIKKSWECFALVDLLFSNN